MNCSVVFISGILAPTQMWGWNYFYKIDSLAKKMGCRAHFISLPAWGTLQSRSRLIQDYLDQNKLTTKIHFICHSKGGLDLRYLLNLNNSWNRVASLTSLAVPYQGSTAAMITLEWLKYFSKLGLCWPVRGGVIETTLKELSSDHLRNLWSQDRVEILSVPKFYIVADQSTHWSRFLFPVFIYFGFKIQKIEGANDGFVSVQSASWGVLLERVKTNHLGLIGHFYGFTFNFDYKSLYHKIFENLQQLEKNSHG